MNFLAPYIVNAGFFTAFFLTCIFAILSSQEILAFLNAKSLTTVYLHKILAYLCIILLGIHLGVNLKRMLKKLEKKTGRKSLPHPLSHHHNLRSILIHQCWLYKPFERKLRIQRSYRKYTGKFIGISKHNPDDNRYCLSDRKSER